MSANKPQPAMGDESSGATKRMAETLGAEFVRHTDWTRTPSPNPESLGDDVSSLDHYLSNIVDGIATVMLADTLEDAKRQLHQLCVEAVANPNPRIATLQAKLERVTEALLGPGDTEENVATLGRFGWLSALFADLTQNEAALGALSAEDPSAHWEAMQEVEALIRDTRAALSNQESGNGPE